MKRVIALILSIAMVASLCTGLAITGFAANPGEVGYSFSKNGGAYIVTKSEGNIHEVSVYEWSKDNNINAIVIPATVTDNGIVYNVTHINGNIFRGHDRLRTIEISEGIKSLGEAAFAHTPDKYSGLEKIVIPGTIESISKDAFNGNYWLNNITIHEGVKNIGESAFEGCTNMISIDLPESIVSIGKNAFKQCSNKMYSIIIPKNVTSISDCAFISCTNLLNVTLQSTTPPELGSQVFDNCSDDLKFLVPEGSVEAYQSAWPDYSGKIEKIPELDSCVLFFEHSFGYDGTIKRYEIQIGSTPDSYEKTYYLPFDNGKIRATLPRGGDVSVNIEVKDDLTFKKFDINGVSIVANISVDEGKTLRISDTSEGSPLYSFGNLSINGKGTIDIDFESLNESQSIAAVSVNGSLTISNGTVNVNARRGTEQNVLGLFAYGSNIILSSSSNVTIQSEGEALTYYGGMFVDGKEVNASNYKRFFSCDEEIFFGGSSRGSYKCLSSTNGAPIRLDYDDSFGDGTLMSYVRVENSGSYIKLKTGDSPENNLMKYVGEGVGKNQTGILYEGDKIKFELIDGNLNITVKKDISFNQIVNNECNTILTVNEDVTLKINYIKTNDQDAFAALGGVYDLIINGKGTIDIDFESTVDYEDSYSHAVAIGAENLTIADGTINVKARGKTLTGICGNLNLGYPANVTVQSTSMAFGGSINVGGEAINNSNYKEIFSSDEEIYLRTISAGLTVHGNYIYSAKNAPIKLDYGNLNDGNLKPYIRYDYSSSQNSITTGNIPDLVIGKINLPYNDEKIGINQKNNVLYITVTDDISLKGIDVGTDLIISVAKGKTLNIGDPVNNSIRTPLYVGGNLEITGEGTVNVDNVSPNTNGAIYGSNVVISGGKVNVTSIGGTNVYGIKANTKIEINSEAKVTVQSEGKAYCAGYAQDNSKGIFVDDEKINDNNYKKLFSSKENFTYGEDKTKENIVWISGSGRISSRDLSGIRINGVAIEKCIGTYSGSITAFDDETVTIDKIDANSDITIVIPENKTLIVSGEIKASSNRVTINGENKESSKLIVNNGISVSSLFVSNTDINATKSDGRAIYSTNGIYIDSSNITADSTNDAAILTNQNGLHISEDSIVKARGGNYSEIDHSALKAGFINFGGAELTKDNIANGDLTYKSAYVVFSKNDDYVIIKKINRLYFETVGADGTIKLEKVGTPDNIELVYKTNTNTDSNWQPFNVDTSYTVELGQKLYIAASDTNSSFSKDYENYYHFVLGGDCTGFNLGNSINSLAKFDCELSKVPADYYFANLFKDCSKLLTAPELPMITLTNYCYAGMFSGCTSLTTAPALPAATLVTGCYSNMFSGCANLLNAPELPVLELADSCYANMFSGCASLVNVPELPAKKMVSNCYNGMFSGCTSLVNAPALIAEILADSCYANMFSGCSNLETATLLNAEKLENNCYESMFSGCTKLNSLTANFAITATDALKDWLNNVAAVGTFHTTNKNITNDNKSIYYIPAGWMLDVYEVNIPEKCMYFEIEDGTTGTIKLTKFQTPEGEFEFEYNRGGSWHPFDSETDYTIGPDQKFYIRAVDYNDYLFHGDAWGSCYHFVLGGDNTGFNCHGSIMSLVTSDCNSTVIPENVQFFGLFYGCYTLLTAPELPATVLSNNCYQKLFSGCASLVTAPELPAMELTISCYAEMFQHCHSLVNAPKLASTNLGVNCYCSMFDGCASLVDAPKLPATVLTDYCYEDMFRGCTSLVTAPELPATTLQRYCYGGMFQNCTNLVTAPELPAKTLVDGCYYFMFDGCSNLHEVSANFTEVVENAKWGYPAIKNWLPKSGYGYVLTDNPEKIQEVFSQMKFEQYVGYVPYTLPDGWMLSGFVSDTNKIDIRNDTLNNGEVTIPFYSKSTRVEKGSDNVYKITINNDIALDYISCDADAIISVRDGKTLTINGTYEDRADGPAIYISNGKNLTVTDKGTIDINSTSKEFVFYVDGKLAVDGTTINVKNSTNTPNCGAIGIQANYFNIKDGHINISIKGDKNCIGLCGLRSQESSIDGGTVNIAVTSKNSYAMDVGGGLRINGGIVTATSFGEDSCGIFSEKWIYLDSTKAKVAVQGEESAYKVKDNEKIFVNNEQISLDNVHDYFKGTNVEYIRNVSINSIFKVTSLGPVTLRKPLVEPAINNYLQVITNGKVRVDKDADAGYVCLSYVVLETNYAKPVNWNFLSFGKDIEVGAGKKLYIKAEENIPNLKGYNFVFSDNATLRGSIMSLVDPSASTTIAPENAFEGLFSNCTKITQIDESSRKFLPATVLKENCYKNMFSGCTGITVAPVISATSMASGCLEGMFDGCTKLKTITYNGTKLGPTYSKNWLNNVDEFGFCITKMAESALLDSHSADTIPLTWVALDERRYTDNSPNYIRMDKDGKLYDKYNNSINSVPNVIITDSKDIKISNSDVTLEYILSTRNIMVDVADGKKLTVTDYIMSTKDLTLSGNGLLNAGSYSGDHLYIIDNLDHSQEINSKALARKYFEDSYKDIKLDYVDGVVTSTNRPITFTPIAEIISGLTINDIAIEKFEDREKTEYGISEIVTSTDGSKKVFTVDTISYTNGSLTVYVPEDVNFYVSGTNKPYGIYVNSDTNFEGDGYIYTKGQTGIWANGDMIISGDLIIDAISTISPSDVIIFAHSIYAEKDDLFVDVVSTKRDNSSQFFSGESVDITDSYNIKTDDGTVRYKFPDKLVINYIDVNADGKKVTYPSDRFNITRTNDDITFIAKENNISLTDINSLYPVLLEIPSNTNLSVNNGNKNAITVANGLTLTNYGKIDISGQSGIYNLAADNICLYGTGIIYISATNNGIDANLGHFIVDDTMKLSIESLGNAISSNEIHVLTKYGEDILTDEYNFDELFNSANLSYAANCISDTNGNIVKLVTQPIPKHIIIYDANHIVNTFDEVKIVTDSNSASLSLEGDFATLVAEYIYSKIPLNISVTEDQLFTLESNNHNKDALKVDGTLTLTNLGTIDISSDVNGINVEKDFCIDGDGFITAEGNSCGITATNINVSNLSSVKAKGATAAYKFKTEIASKDSNNAKVVLSNDKKNFDGASEITNKEVKGTGFVAIVSPICGVLINGTEISKIPNNEFGFSNPGRTGNTISVNKIAYADGLDIYIAPFATLNVNNPSGNAISSVNNIKISGKGKLVVSSSDIGINSENGNIEFGKTDITVFASNTSVSAKNGEIITNKGTNVKVSSNSHRAFVYSIISYENEDYCDITKENCQEIVKEFIDNVSGTDSYSINSAYCVLHDPHVVIDDKCIELINNYSDYGIGITPIVSRDGKTVTIDRISVTNDLNIYIPMNVTLVVSATDDSEAIFASDGNLMFGSDGGKLLALANNADGYAINVVGDLTFNGTDAEINNTGKGINANAVNVSDYHPLKIAANKMLVSTTNGIKSSDISISDKYITKENKDANVVISNGANSLTTDKDGYVVICKEIDFIKISKGGNITQPISGFNVIKSGDIYKIMQDDANATLTSIESKKQLVVSVDKNQTLTISGNESAIKTNDKLWLQGDGKLSLSSSLSVYPNIYSNGTVEVSIKELVLSGNDTTCIKVVGKGNTLVIKTGTNISANTTGVSAFTTEDGNIELSCGAHILAKSSEIPFNAGNHEILVVKENGMESLTSNKAMEYFGIFGKELYTSCTDTTCQAIISSDEVEFPRKTPKIKVNGLIIEAAVLNDYGIGSIELDDDINGITIDAISATTDLDIEIPEGKTLTILAGSSEKGIYVNGADLSINGKGTLKVGGLKYSLYADIINVDSNVSILAKSGQMGAFYATDKINLIEQETIEILQTNVIKYFSGTNITFVSNSGESSVAGQADTWVVFPKPITYIEILSANKIKKPTQGFTLENRSGTIYVTAQDDATLDFISSALPFVIDINSGKTVKVVSNNTEAIKVTGSLEITGEGKLIAEATRNAAIAADGIMFGENVRVSAKGYSYEAYNTKGIKVVDNTALTIDSSNVYDYFDGVIEYAKDKLKGENWVNYPNLTYIKITENKIVKPDTGFEVYKNGGLAYITAIDTMTNLSYIYSEYPLVINIPAGNESFVSCQIPSRDAIVANGDLTFKGDGYLDVISKEGTGVSATNINVDGGSIVVTGNEHGVVAGGTLVFSVDGEISAKGSVDAFKALTKLQVKKNNGALVDIIDGNYTNYFPDADISFENNALKKPNDYVKFSYSETVRLGVMAERISNTDDTYEIHIKEYAPNNDYVERITITDWNNNVITTATNSNFVVTVTSDTNLYKVEIYTKNEISSNASINLSIIRSFINANTEMFMDVYTSSYSLVTNTNENSISNPLFITDDSASKLNLFVTTNQKNTFISKLNSALSKVHTPGIKQIEIDKITDSMEQAKESFKNSMSYCPVGVTGTELVFNSHKDASPEATYYYAKGFYTNDRFERVAQRTGDNLGSVDLYDAGGYGFYTIKSIVTVNGMEKTFYNIVVITSDGDYKQAMIDTLYDQHDVNRLPKANYDNFMKLIGDIQKTEIKNEGKETADLIARAKTVIQDIPKSASGVITTPTEVEEPGELTVLKYGSLVMLEVTGAKNAVVKLSDSNVNLSYNVNLSSGIGTFETIWDGLYEITVNYNKDNLTYTTVTNMTESLKPIEFTSKQASPLITWNVTKDFEIKHIYYTIDSSDQTEYLTLDNTDRSAELLTYHGEHNFKVIAKYKDGTILEYNIPYTANVDTDNKLKLNVVSKGGAVYVGYTGIDTSKIKSIAYAKGNFRAWGSMAKYAVFVPITDDGYVFLNKSKFEKNTEYTFYVYYNDKDESFSVVSIK